MILDGAYKNVYNTIYFFGAFYDFLQYCLVTCNVYPKSRASWNIASISTLGFYAVISSQNKYDMKYNLYTEISTFNKKSRAAFCPVPKRDVDYVKIISFKSKYYYSISGQ